MPPNVSAEQLLDLLPQTQCARCGYPDCAAYAQAMAEDKAAINRCPPGGAEGVRRLARVVGIDALPLDPDCGVEKPLAVALIDENWCIGCTLCLKACPTDAIVGSNKLMHTVVDVHCTGCELCLPVCPVDCIRMVPVSGAGTGWDAWSPAQADAARRRYAFHQQRMQRSAAEQEARREARAREKLADLAAHSLHTDPEVLARKRAVIETALARARARRENSSS